MPSKKYYNLAAWHAKQLERGRKKQAVQVERTGFDDEAERAREIRRAQTERSDAVAKLMAANMKHGEGIVADMQEQEQAKFKMRTAYATGDTATARELANTLDPSRVTAEDLKKQFGSYAPSLSSMKK